MATQLATALDDYKSGTHRDKANRERDREAEKERGREREIDIDKAGTVAGSMWAAPLHCFFFCVWQGLT